MIEHGIFFWYFAQIGGISFLSFQFYTILQLHFRDFSVCAMCYLTFHVFAIYLQFGTKWRSKFNVVLHFYTVNIPEISNFIYVTFEAFKIFDEIPSQFLLRLFYENLKIVQVILPNHSISIGQKSDRLLLSMYSLSCASNFGFHHYHMEVSFAQHSRWQVYQLQLIDSYNHIYWWDYMYFY